MAVKADKILDEAAKQITNSLFKKIDKQRVDPNFLQNFANELLKRFYSSQKKTTTAEVKVTKELTTLVGQVKKIYNSLFKELTALQKTIKAKDSSISKIKNVETETNTTIKEIAAVNEINKLDTTEEQREGRPGITQQVQKDVPVIVKKFDDKSLEQLKNIFSSTIGKDLAQKLSLGTGSLGTGVPQNASGGIFDALINGALFAGGAGLAAKGGATLFQKIKNLFSKQKTPPVTPPGKGVPGSKPATPGKPEIPGKPGTPPVEGSKFSKILGKLTKIAGKLAFVDAGFNIAGSIGELKNDKDLGTAQKFGAGATSLLGTAPDVLINTFDPTSWVSLGSEFLGYESPVGEGAVFELANLLGLKDENRSFGETLRKRSKEMFKEYNTYMQDLEERAQLTRERGGAGLQDVLAGQTKAQKQGYILRDINQKVTPKQFAMYYHGKISEEDFQKIAGPPSKQAKSAILAKEKTKGLDGSTSPLIRVTSTPLDDSVKPESIERKTEQVILPDNTSKPSSKIKQPTPTLADVNFEEMGISLADQNNLNKALSMELEPLKNQLNGINETTEEYNHSFRQGIDDLNESFKQKFEIFTAPPEKLTPNIKDFFDPKQFALNNSSLDQIAENTEGTQSSIEFLGKTILRLATVFGTKMNTSPGTTIINANNGNTQNIPAAVVAKNNFDPIQQVRQQFANV